MTESLPRSGRMLLGVLALFVVTPARAADASVPVLAGEAPAAEPSGVAQADPAPADAVAQPEPSATGETGETPADTTSPEDVSVRGTTLRETGGSAHVVGDAQLRRFSFDDAQQVLVQVPGVYMRTEDGVGLRPNIGIRGASSDRSKKVTLMEDGVLLGPAPYSAPAAYYFPLMERMRTVRVVKGPSAISYGPHTVGGAIDLVTREIPSARRGTYDFAVGQYGYNREHLTFGSSDESVGFLLEGIRLANSGFKQLDGGGDTGFTRSEWMAKASWDPAPGASVQNEIGLKLGYSEETSNETYLGITDADARATPDRRYLASQFDRMDNHRTLIEATHKMRFSPKLDVTTTVYRHDFARIWRKVNGFRGADISDVLANPDTSRNAVFKQVLTGDVDAQGDAQTIMIGPNNRVFVSQGLQTEVHAEARSGPVSHRVTYGARGHYDEIVRKHTQDGFVMRSRTLVPDGRVTETTADNKASTWALAMYVLDAMSVGPVTVTPGARLEAIRAEYRDALANVHDGAIYQVVLPGVSGYLALNRELGLLAGVHEGFSPVPPEQARSSRPEESVNYEAGMRWTHRRARAEAIGFYNHYRNLTNICTESSGCASGVNLDRQFDAGKARIAGVELFAEGDIPLSPDMSIPLRAAYTYTYTEFLNSFKSDDPLFGTVQAGDEIPYVPPNQAWASIGLETTTWGVSTAGTFVDAMREKAGHGEPKPGELTDAYFLLDASAKYKVLPHVELYLNARNLLDDRYIASRRPFGARPGAPRWASVGVRGDF